jgi:hypothetical protein
VTRRCHSSADESSVMTGVDTQSPARSLSMGSTRRRGVNDVDTIVKYESQNSLFNHHQIKTNIALS